MKTKYINSENLWDANEYYRVLIYLGIIGGMFVLLGLVAIYLHILTFWTIGQVTIGLPTFILLAVFAWFFSIRKWEVGPTEIGVISFFKRPIAQIEEGFGLVISVWPFEMVLYKTVQTQRQFPSEKLEDIAYAGDEIPAGKVAPLFTQTSDNITVKYYFMIAKEIVEPLHTFATLGYTALVSGEDEIFRRLQDTALPAINHQIGKKEFDTVSIGSWANEFACPEILKSLRTKVGEPKALEIYYTIEKQLRAFTAPSADKAKIKDEIIVNLDLMMQETASMDSNVRYKKILDNLDLLSVPHPSTGLYNQTINEVYELVEWDENSWGIRISEVLLVILVPKQISTAQAEKKKQQIDNAKNEAMAIADRKVTEESNTAIADGIKKSSIAQNDALRDKVKIETDAEIKKKTAILKAQEKNPNAARAEALKNVTTLAGDGALTLFKNVDEKK